MKRALMVLPVLLIAASCTMPAEKGTPTQQAVISAVGVDGPLIEMSHAEIAAMESAAVRILARGPSMIGPLLAEIEASDNPDKRLVLIKILHLAIDGMPSAAGLETYHRQIEGTARRLLKSNQGADRYAGLLLMGLPQKSRIVSVAIDMLGDADEDNRAFVISILNQVSGRDFGYRADGSSNERAAALDRWRQWWRKNRERDVYSQPSANPVLLGFRAETNRITSSAGPYSVAVTDKDGNGVPGAVVAYSYGFSTPDGIGKVIKGREMTDPDGKVLTSGERMVSGLTFMGMELIVSKRGYKRASLRISRNILTPNSFPVDVKLESE